MKKFRFKLETLLKVTRMKREDAEVAFAEASRKLEEAREQLGEMLADMQRSQQKFDKLARNGAKLPMERIVAYHQFFNYKRRQIEQQNRLILERRGKKQQKMKELMDLMMKPCMKSRRYWTSSASSWSCAGKGQPHDGYNGGPGRAGQDHADTASFWHPRRCAGHGFPPDLAERNQ